jgi:dolichol-phosphate mannosyltransferase
MTSPSEQPDDRPGGLPAGVELGAGVLVVIPTYQERLNVEEIVGRTRAAVPRAHVLVVDDASPDGTGALADALASDDDQVHVLHRVAKQGIGVAYLAGFAWGLGREFDVLVEMDADGSHQPEQLPSLLAALTGADLVQGSRWVPGGSVVNWPRRRELLSRGGNQYVRTVLGVDVRDATGGFRAFRRSTLEKLDLAGVASAGYCFQVDLVWRTVRQGFRVVEVPIEFVERVRGESKMSGAIVREALWRVTVWGVQERLGRLPGRTGGR